MKYTDEQLAPIAAAVAGLACDDDRQSVDKMKVYLFGLGISVSSDLGFAIMDLLRTGSQQQKAAAAFRWSDVADLASQTAKQVEDLTKKLELWTQVRTLDDKTLGRLLARVDILAEQAETNRKDILVNAESCERESNKLHELII
tara:strand:- start:460 stop:891 length:432 start_codon:yes stop_codon:yes gene_type:complete